MPGLDLTNINIGASLSSTALISGAGLGFVSFLLSLNSDSTAANAKVTAEAAPAQKDDELIAKLTAVIDSHKDEGYSANLLN